MNLHVSPRLVAEFTPAAYDAVDRAMRDFHERDPLKYHAQRPTLKTCPFFEPTQDFSGTGLALEECPWLRR